MSGKADELISRQDAIEAIKSLWNNAPSAQHLSAMFDCEDAIRALPSTKSVKAYTKADYIMALHKEYGCTLARAEEAHNKALEYLRSKARMKG